MLTHAKPVSGPRLTPFWVTLGGLPAALAAAGAIYAQIEQVPALTAASIVAAFLLATPLLVIPGFPSAREAILRSWPARHWALAVFAGSLLPYLAYAIPAGVFDPLACARLAALCASVPGIYLLWPPRRKQALGWQDAAALSLLAYPMVSGLSPLLREIYPSPIPEIVPRLDILGKLMLIGLGANSFLLLRGVPGAGYRFAIHRQDLAVGLKNFLLFMALGIPAAFAVGAAAWSPPETLSWSLPFVILAHAAGLHFAVSLSEEMFFRGILQNLASHSLGQPAAQLGASLLFGLAHLARGWQYAALAALAGWFYGRAFRQGGGVVPAAVAHTLVVVTQRFFFT